jgi:hypothetical protein
MSTTDRKKMHPLSVLHLLGMVALLVWWGFYFWHHSPSRALFRAHRPSGTVGRGGSLSGAIERGAGATLAEATARAGSAVNTALADISGGLFVLALFGVATGIYVRRFEIWLQARGSGEAMTLAGTGLGDKALAANVARGGGVR